MKLTSANASHEQPAAWSAQGSSARRRYWLAMRSLLVLAVLVAALLGLACGDDGRSRAGTTVVFATALPSHSSAVSIITVGGPPGTSP